jgi:hypothetical protein
MHAMELRSTVPDARCIMAIPRKIIFSVLSFGCAQLDAAVRELLK